MASPFAQIPSASPRFLLGLEVLSPFLNSARRLQLHGFRKAVATGGGCSKDERPSGGSGRRLGQEDGLEGSRVISHQCGIVTVLPKRQISTASGQFLLGREGRLFRDSIFYLARYRLPCISFTK